jgi:hypothetical protein
MEVPNDVVGHWSRPDSRLPNGDPRIMRYELTGEEWAAIEPMLLNKARGGIAVAGLDRRPSLLPMWAKCLVGFCPG